MKFDILQATFKVKAVSNVEMPVVGLGTWKLDAPALKPVLERAVELGCRHIDCAMIYENEGAIGGVLKSIFDNKGRFKVDRKDDLQLTYLDLYLIHWPFSFEADEKGYSRIDENGVAVVKPVPLAETWSAMEELVKQGKVRAIGVSNFTCQHLKQMIDSGIRPAVNQVEMHPYLPQPKLLKFCDDNGIKVIAYSALGTGETPSLMKDPVVVKVAKSLQMTPAQVLLSWAITRGTAVIPKTSNPTRLEENFNLRMLDAESMRQLNDIQTHHRYICPVAFWKRDCFDHDLS